MTHGCDWQFEEGYCGWDGFAAYRRLATARRIRDTPEHEPPLDHPRYRA